MTKFEERPDEDGARAEVMQRFVATLIVTTLMAALTAYVLGLAVLAPERAAASRSAVAQTSHVRL
jgi:hypothetical protein